MKQEDLILEALKEIKRDINSLETACKDNLKKIYSQAVQVATLDANLKNQKTSMDRMIRGLGMAVALVLGFMGLLHK